MAYIGQGIKQGTFKVLDTSGNTYNGSNTTFSLGTQVGSAAQLLVSHDGVIQLPGTDYTLASGGASITFSTAPASGASIFITEISGAVGGTVTPSDTSVTADKLNTALLTGHTDIGANIADADLFLIDDGAGGTLRKTAASRIKTYVGGVSLANDANNRVVTADGSDGLNGEANLTFDGTQLSVLDTNAGTDNLLIKTTGDNTVSLAIEKSDIKFDIGVDHNNDGSKNFYIRERTQDGSLTNAVRMMINSSGNVGVGTTNPGGSLANGVGFQILATGYIQANVTNGQAANFARTNDGQLIQFSTGTTGQGNISISGGTVSYNAFAGSHWSRLADNSKPTILRGTVLDSIATLCDWYQVEYTKDSKTLTEYIGALPSGKSVGDSHTVTIDGVDYTGTISKEENERLPMCKISNTEDSKAVYGVFMDWDVHDDKINDMYVTSLGAFVVRIHKDETVAIGDYLQSKGDGTAKKQADDILRASTIAKVTSTEKTHEYADGSYCVPCTLHCG